MQSAVGARGRISYNMRYLLISADQCPWRTRASLVQEHRLNSRCLETEKRSKEHVDHCKAVVRRSRKSLNRIMREEAETNL